MELTHSDRPVDGSLLDEPVDVALPDPGQLLDRLQKLRAAVESEARSMVDAWQPRITRQSFLPSARNLGHYLALRKRDLRSIQAELALWGLSSLGRSEARVLPNLDAVIATLGAIVGNRAVAGRRPSLQQHRDGERRLDANTSELFGAREGERRIRIMVTMATSAADESPEVRDLIIRGMDCARINCAHDNADVWGRIVANVRAASRELRRPCCILMDLSGPRLRIDAVQATTAEPRVWPGDRIRFRGVDRAVPNDSAGMADVRFEIACTIMGVVEALRPDHRVYIDGGKVDAVVESLEPGAVILKVTRTGPKGGKLVREKGLNFPDTPLALGALTGEDRNALDFVTAHADIIGYSFVQCADDVAELQRELGLRLPADARMPALIAKIETRRALEELPEIIVQAAGTQAFGVMIARGDLGVELGFERLAEVQEEILWLAEAAHIPVVWATQVLERLVAKGTPSRAEMTDAAMGERAECVMLNKGPFVAQAVDVLNDVLTRMQSHQRKKSAQLRALRVWQ